MPFKLVYYSQNDPKWKDDRLGLSEQKSDTIGYVGCALTSVAMMLSGHGFTETPKSLNEKLKKIGGFAGSGIRWHSVSQLHPEIRSPSIIKCHDTPAPLAQIDAALAKGQPVIVAVDSTAAPGYLSHYVLLIGRKGNDYLMLDPWPYQKDVNKETYLMPRYSHGSPLQRSIMQIVMFENVNADGRIQLPGESVPTAPETTPEEEPRPAPAATGPRARVKSDVTAGLNVRKTEDTSSKANIVEVVPAGTLLAITEPGGWREIGMINQWVGVRTPKGNKGLVAAWYLERVPGEIYPETTETAAEPQAEVSEPAAETPPKKSKLVVRVRRSGVPVYTSNYGRGKIVSTEKNNARLVVVEDAARAAPKVGAAGKWLHVKASNNKRGFIDAASVRLV
ncbi:MAG TPA: C39 family peptidase [Anaerolineales bacterium]|nr:C39 family peptidase [Anaerolineales bacterium]